MSELINAKTASERSKIARAKAFERAKSAAVEKINNAIQNGDYSIVIDLIFSWTKDEFKNFWDYFAAKGYHLQLGVYTDREEATETYILGFVNWYLTVSWGDTF